MKQVSILSVFASVLALALLSASPLPAALSPDEFRNPPIQARPSAFWAWLNGNVDRAQITRELEEMKAKGKGDMWETCPRHSSIRKFPAPTLRSDCLISIHLHHQN